MDQKRDSDHPSEKKCNQPDCWKSKCWYFHKTLTPNSNDVINQQDIQRFTCKTCQKFFIDMDTQGLLLTCSDLRVDGSRHGKGGGAGRKEGGGRLSGHNITQHLIVYLTPILYSTK